MTEPERYVSLVERAEKLFERLRAAHHDVVEFVCQQGYCELEEDTLAAISEAADLMLEIAEAGASQDHAPTITGGDGAMPVPSWRPIASAPKDGTLILACQRPDEGSVWFKTWEQWKAPQTVAWRGFHPNAPGKQTWRDAKGSPVTVDLWRPLDGLAVTR